MVVAPCGIGEKPYSRVWFLGDEGEGIKDKPEKDVSVKNRDRVWGSCSGSEAHANSAEISTFREFPKSRNEFSTASAQLIDRE